MGSDYLDLLIQLRGRGVHFVIVGGVAAALHGGSRVTFDLDIVASPEPASWAAAIDLLWSLGARPRIPKLTNASGTSSMSNDGSEKKGCSR
jgi:hypothetical protein